MSSQYRRTGRVAQIVFVVLLATSAVRGQVAAPAPAQTDETVLMRPLRAKACPTPRSPDLPGAFPATPHVLLPALAAEDVVGVGGTEPLVNGRVYPISIRSDVDGSWSVLEDGSMLWTVSVASPNAAGLRLRFERFGPPRETEVIVYSAEQPAEARGPLRPRPASGGTVYWTPRVSGREARVEWFVPAELAETGGRGVLEISGALQVFPDPPDASERGSACRLDVTCHPEWQTTARAVGRVEFVQGGSGHLCSGAMLNRLPSADFCPLFLTAAHCIEDQDVASTMDIFWFFQTSTCDGTPPSLGSLPFTHGATLLRREGGFGSSDTCLLGLPVDDVPSGVTFAGWSSSEAPDPTPATLIHHPLGMRKSWSPGNLQGLELLGQCPGTATDVYHFQLTTGGQDGGSSGSPVFDNANHRVRAVATCSESDECIPAEHTSEGSFAGGYPNMVMFLNAGSDVWVQPGWTGLEFGTADYPFDTLVEGCYGVHGGGTLHLRTGVGYPEAFQFSRGMTVVAEGGVVRIGG